jgi:hypothetical protein
MSITQRLRVLLRRPIDYLQVRFPPNRIVLLLTPLATPLAAAASAWIASHFPGVELSEGAIIGFAAVAALGVLRGAYKWVDRWQEEERSGDRAFETRRETELAQAKTQLRDSEEVLARTRAQAAEQSAERGKKATVAVNVADAPEVKAALQEAKDRIAKLEGAAGELENELRLAHEADKAALSDDDREPTPEQA